MPSCCTLISFWFGLKIGTVGFCCSGGRVLLRTVLNKNFNRVRVGAASSRGVTVSKLSSPHHMSSNVSCCSTCQLVKHAEPSTFPYFVRVKHICACFWCTNTCTRLFCEKVQRGIFQANGSSVLAHAKEEGHNRTPGVRLHYKCETEGRYN